MDGTTFTSRYWFDNPPGRREALLGPLAQPSAR